MKLLFDFLPILLFFLTFKYADAQKEWAADWAGRHVGFLVSGGTVAQADAPVLLATLVVIGGTLLQIAVLLLRRKRIDTMLWVSLALVVVLGGATIWFHNATFIKWKPSVLYWSLSLALWSAQAFFGRNLVQKMLGEQMTLPTPVWRKLNVAWIGFFLAMGVVNLIVAYNFSTAVWVNFKLFGIVGLMLVFFLLQGIYLGKHMPEEVPVGALGKGDRIP